MRHNYSANYHGVRIREIKEKELEILRQWGNREQSPYLAYREVITKAQ